MTKLKCLAVIVVALLMSGCPLRSYLPLFMEKDLILNPALVGTWVDKGNKDTLTFLDSKDKSYKLIHHAYQFDGGFGKKVRPGDTAIFQAQLGRIGKFWFLDLSPEGNTLVNLKNDAYVYHLMPVHTVWKIWLKGDSLQLAALDERWLRRMIDNHNLRISRLRARDEIVLTASTDEIQQMVLRFAEDEDAFPEPKALTRLK